MATHKTADAYPATGMEVNKAPERGSMAGSIRMLVVITTSILVVVIAAKNSLTWLLDQFLLASGCFWTRQYEVIYNLFGGNEFLILSLGTLLVSTVVYWTLASGCLFVDATGKPSWIHKYKIQQDKNIPVDPALLRQAVTGTLFNQFAVGLPFLLVCAWLSRMRGCSASTRLPEFHSVLLEMLVFLAVEEIGFYYLHRLFHHSFFYKRFHKRHHEYTAPFAVSNFDVHWLEHAVANLAPMAAGPLIAGSHVATTWFWLTIGTFSSLLAHSGYHLPFLPSTEAHDFHHLKFVNNFGALGILDRLHGTDAIFRQSQNFQRDVLLTGFTPASELGTAKGN
ncbi:fatty acid hydroxylase domain-containing protein 2-like [Patiria miniata]|uniref:Fatty acid hydroxylase domain-containing protein n=1 Tax=Patiria miniata TaxID=46514 RepID=A0A913ZZ53_PATMI|nr:fatty acid hydroxylase domain-containing protein 2-like [Patiria miniata]